MNIGLIIIIAIAGIWALGLFFGAIGGLSKTFTHSPTVMDSSSLKTQEHQSIEDTKEKQQKLMDDMKQKMQDAAAQRY
jgi:hypothetical protein